LSVWVKDVLPAIIRNDRSQKRLSLHAAIVPCLTLYL